MMAATRIPVPVAESQLRVEDGGFGGGRGDHGRNAKDDVVRPATGILIVVFASSQAEKRGSPR